MPFVEAPLLQLVTEWPGAGTVIPVRGGRLQYGCARYGRAALIDARLALSRGRSALRTACIDGFGVVTEPAWHAVAPLNALDDIDTPEDRARSIDAHEAGT